MKILFAVSSEDISEKIIKRYQKEYKEILSYKNVYYFNAIIKEIQKDKTYDRIIISEDLEPFTNSNYDTIDKFIFDKLDSISDEANDNDGKETAIILICSERRARGNSILVKLFGIGIYNALLGNDRSIEQVCRLINKPRSKKDAKAYYSIDSDDVNYKSESENEVSETEIQNILTHFKKLGRDTDKYTESFENIANQYTMEQLKIVVNCLPTNVKLVLEQTSQRYREVMSSMGMRRMSTDTRVKAKIKNPGLKVNLINNDVAKPNQGSIVIPSSVKASGQSANIPKSSNVIRQENNNSIDINYQTLPSSTEEDIFQNSEKRGRGRPKKMTNMGNNMMEKRGRGRPRKIQGTAINNTNPQEQDFQDEVLPGLEDEITLPGFDEEPIQSNYDIRQDNMANNSYSQPRPNNTMNNSYSQPRPNNVINNPNVQPQNIIKQPEDSRILPVSDGVDLSEFLDPGGFENLGDNGYGEEVTLQGIDELEDYNENDDNDINNTNSADDGLDDLLLGMDQDESSNPNTMQPQTNNSQQVSNENNNTNKTNENSKPMHAYRVKSGGLKSRNLIKPKGNNGPIKAEDNQELQQPIQNLIEDNDEPISELDAFDISQQFNSGFEDDSDNMQDGNLYQDNNNTQNDNFYQNSNNMQNNTQNNSFYQNSNNMQNDNLYQDYNDMQDDDLFMDNSNEMGMSNNYETNQFQNNYSPNNYQGNSSSFDMNNSIESLQPKIDYSMSNLNSVLTQDKKIITFIGTTKNGTSFLVNNLASIFNSLNINTAILDMTKNRNSYYIYTKNEEELRKIAYTSIDKLETGYASGIPVDRNLTVYTALPNNGKTYSNAEPILTTLVQNHSVVLIDCDFDTDPSYFASCQEIYLVQSLDILTIQPLTAFLRDLKTKGILEPEKVRVVINKDMRVGNLSNKVIIAGMSFYNDPAMSFMTELFNKDMVKYCVIPFDEKAYAKYLEAIVDCKVSHNSYSSAFINQLRKLGDMVYPLTSGKQSYSNQYNNQRTGFSNNMNSTLNKMRKKF